jgi:hypothetical protein
MGDYAPSSSYFVERYYLYIESDKLVFDPSQELQNRIKKPVFFVREECL